VHSTGRTANTLVSCNHNMDVMAMEQTLLSHYGREDNIPPPEKPGYLALSRTTDRVLQILLGGDLARLRADSVAESLGMSSTTLRRRLRADHTCYQFLLDRARQYRCEQVLRSMWRPGKCLADELGYLEVNSFYRAFRRWTGLSYSEYKLRHCS
jgi:AraC family mar-sox-rob regulon transcriptional activator